MLCVCPMPKTFSITTAIDYTNAAPHIGHAYEKILADVLARYHRLKGEQVFFLTGVDQHGQKVQQSAQKQGVEPAEFAQGVTVKFLALWEKLGLSHDAWAATTDPLHKAVVRKILQQLFDAGEIYKAAHSGFYSVRQEQFLTDKERGPDGNFGPEWGEVNEITEENYYFRLAQHRDWLLGYIDTHPEYVTPSFRQGELRNAVERLSGDLCISRPKARLEWGIELPFDSGYVTYVWFDALINYISFAGYWKGAEPRNAEFESRWPALHVIGKDIIIPAHGVYWPIMLKALGFADEEMPTLLVHGWWNISGAKMSKSLGNSIDPDVLADKYGAETLRYYLMSDIATGRDADFSEERLVQRYNTDLANSLGNLLNRSLNMAAKYRDGRISAPAAGAIRDAVTSADRTSDWFITAMEGSTPGEEFRAAFKTDQGGVEKASLGLVHRALEAVSDHAVFCNRLVEESAPWKLAKDPAQAERLDAVLYTLAESLRIIAILISPVLPKAAHGIFDQLAWKLADSGRDERFSLADAQWGGLPDGHVLGKPTPLFPRIEAPPAA